MRYSSTLVGLLTFLLTCAGICRAAPVHLGYQVESAFGGLTFQEPTQIVFAPGDLHRAFVTERAGRVALIPDLDHPTREVFLDLTTRVGNGGPDHGLLSLAFHPKFAQNGYFFLWYSMVQDGQRYNRLARFTVSPTDPTQVDLSTEYPLITQATGKGGHDGGTLLFGADSYLYLSLGDGDSTDPEAAASHQRIDRSFFGGIIRIDVDQNPANASPTAHPSVHPGTYRVPADNPFVNLGSTPSATVRTEFWAYGLRNPFRIAFDSVTGRLWCADVGLDKREEIDLIRAGGNYGWDYREGSVVGPRGAAPPEISSTLIDPIFEYGHDQGLSITGGLVYRGTALPGLNGAYLFSDFVSGRIWALIDNGQRPLSSAQVTQIASESGLVGFTIDPRQGDLLAADLNDNVIRRITTDTVAVAPQLSHLLNLSARAVVGTGAEILIPGFIVSGAPKTVLVRAVGPTLASFGLQGAVQKPLLTLRGPSGVVARNQGWDTSENLAELKAAIERTGAFPFALGTADSAVVATLPPGAYTAVTEGADGGTGTGLVEVYEADADLGTAGRLVNLSTRARVGTADGILIAGVIVAGSAPRTILVRASGPALAAFNVSPVLAKPLLSLFSGSQKIAENDGWTTAPDVAALRSAMARVAGFQFAEGSADSAFLLTLLPGAYTLQVAGKDGGTGIALVELYEMP